MCGTGKFTRRFMLLAQSQNMTNGDYVFVRMNLVPRPNTKVVWLASGYGIPDDGLDDLAKLAMQPMILVFCWLSMYGRVSFNRKQMELE